MYNHEDSKRILVLKEVDRENILGPIVYWMNREMRVQDNWSLSIAQAMAVRERRELIVVYNLEEGYLGGQERQMWWKTKPLAEIAESLAELSIGFHVIHGTNTHHELVSWLLSIKASAVVTDMCPLRISKKWNEYVAWHFDGSFYLVDAHNIIPVWTASSKQEFAARTIRSKIWKLIENYLELPPKIKKHPIESNIAPHDKCLKIDSGFTFSEEITTLYKPGEVGAKKVLREFLNHKVNTYDRDRNNANTDGQSGLSPYLHYGNIYAGRVIHELMKSTNRIIRELLPREKNASGADAGLGGAPAFVEELIVRKELSDNYCWYNEHYDSIAGAPEWARETLDARRADGREYVYSYKQFEQAKTHDALWNAAQSEMVRTGKMHGYLRMYWAKKIMEWTPDPETAIKYAIKLNDTYSLDGRDPNGYVGIMWSICGLHDRPWFPRKIFGTVRYMAESGCKKQFDVKRYIEKWR